MTRNPTARSRRREAGAPLSRLAAHGGPRTVRAKPPDTWDLGPAEIGREETRAVVDVLNRRTLFRFGLPPAESYVARFERAFARKCRLSHAVAVNSGTSALICGLIGLGVGPGDEVLVPAYTYIATAAAVLAVGAIPILVEVDRSLTLDPADMERKIGRRTRAVIPVHMRGYVCDLGRVVDTSRRHGLRVLEDCAQANGAYYRRRPVGTWGDAGAFSLQQFKVITAGEGGVLVTSDEEVFMRAALYHDAAYMFWMERFGDADTARRWHQRAFWGENYRMSELNGALAYVQLQKRDRILARTRLIKRRWRAVAAESFGPERLELSHDPEGECGLALTLFLHSPEQAELVSRWLQAEGVRCGTRFSREIPDRHVFYHWEYILEKRTPHRCGFPWVVGERQCDVVYSREQCPRTLDWLGRAVVIPITHRMSEAYVRGVERALEKVGRAMR